MLLKQIRALEISQVGLPFKLDISVTPEGMGWALWNKKIKKKEQVPIGFCSQLSEGADQIHSNRRAIIGSVYSPPADGDSQLKKKSQLQ